MPAVHHTLPSVSDTQARSILADHWGLRGTLRPLHGERDRNFHVRTTDGAEYVLKIANALDDRSLLELQNAALAHVAGRAPAVPVSRVLPTQDGALIAEASVNGEAWLVRLLSWLPGKPMAAVRPHTPTLLRQLGQTLGSLTSALSTFSHTSAKRDLKWDLARADWITEHVPRLANRRRRARIEDILDDFATRLAPALIPLRTGIVHNDANDHNIVVAFDAQGAPSVSGILDFGDLLETHTVADAAIALAYAMMHHPGPLSAAAHLVAGYHGACALTEAEVALLIPLARVRLAVSVTNAALQAELEPANEYLQVSERAAWELLDKLDTVHDRFAEYRLREACGLPPVPKSVAVSAWMSAPERRFAPVVEGAEYASGPYVHDFSVSSTEIGTLDTWRDRERFGRHVADVLRDAHARSGIGRYDEVRAIYTTDLFRVAGNDGPEWRTLHIGIDVGRAEGTRVFAPMAGRIVSLRDNAGEGDYGPTIILEHTIDVPAADDTVVPTTFYTLYGHLSRESLSLHATGDLVAAGEHIAWLGDYGVNGGWWPHLHFQIICDLLDADGDFPGVARPAEREVYLSLCPDPSPMLGLPPSARAPRPPSIDSLRERRAKGIGKSLSVSYRRPLHIVRGVMQHLIDADGRRYLDGVNNVAHVGHAHPAVVRAGQRQMAVLSTNTRYLHEQLLEYAERLTATLPDPLRVCYFVCSGSEANELALRLARAHTAERDVIVLEAGYHGNTSTLVEVSPYKFDGPGGSGAPEWVQKVPMPDTYRGPFARTDADAGTKYAQAVRDAVGSIRQAGRRPSAFLCESILSCGGQIVLPPGYLAEAYRHVRAAGGVCIADEVQVGFGRVGTHMWAFETQGVVPDIVTMGKPIGNGHPLGAVVTTPDIAASFANGMEYFNTFGGNPVSCAIGLSVLDVMAAEHLQANALETGAYLMKGLQAVGATHELVGDVRGLGLFIGVELVNNRDLHTPASRQASYVANRMRDLGVLMSTDGPDNNVLKIKPPMCFGRADADQMVETLAVVLSEDPAHPTAR